MLGNKGVVITQDSAYAKEMRKHEATHTIYGAPGRPFVYHEYPKQMYKFEHVSGKGIVQADSQRAEDEHQERNLLSRGFHQGPQAAYDAIQREQTEFGRLAAEREYQIQHGRLSERATAEVRAAEQEHGARHLPDVPETPIRRRGRKPKLHAEG